LAGLTASNSEAFREIRQGAVRVDGERVSNQRMSLEPGRTYILAVGKRRIRRVVVEPFASAASLTGESPS
jgi:tyrosyl-tRNA synthetase